ncbi:MAG TPA: hypothetical protein VFN91_12565, partial [Myxococcaceae bacterium]|nr:hypothetical protein [Myxococcaceae bacterium]
MERRVSLLLALLLVAAPVRAQGPVAAAPPVVSSVKLQMRGGGQVPADLQGLVAAAPARAQGPAAGGQAPVV